jgi:hypothetical protein
MLLSLLSAATEAVGDLNTSAQAVSATRVIVAVGLFEVVLLSANLF